MAETKVEVDTDPTRVVPTMEHTTGIIVGIMRTARIIDRREEQAVVAEDVHHIYEEAEALEEEISLMGAEAITNNIIKIMVVDPHHQHRISTIVNHIEYHHQATQ